MNQYRNTLTAEQKRRKQAIRNWKRAQQELVNYCDFAIICKNRFVQDNTDRVMKNAYNNLCYSLKDIFVEYDKQEEIKYQSEILAEKVVNYLYE